MSEKSFKSIDEQLKILKSKNLRVANEADTIRKLSEFGYYEIINGYRSTFINNEKLFKAGTTFDDIFALYYFDSKVRAAVMVSLEYAESFLKQTLAFTLAEKYGVLFDEYVSNSAFDAGSKLSFQNPRKKLYTSRDLLFLELRKIRDRKTEPFLHYRDFYGNIPPWILVKGMTFGNLRAAITLMKPEDKKILIQRVFNSDVYSRMTYEEASRLFFETIKLINKFRNRAAHGGRMYNYFPSKTGFTYISALYNKINISKKSITRNKALSCNLLLLFTALGLWRNDYSVRTFKQNLKLAVEGYSTKWKNQLPSVLAEMQMPDSFFE
jgi:abortive infection bacteriophage resistance protein